jgi:hypothetical protein
MWVSLERLSKFFGLLFGFFAFPSSSVVDTAHSVSLWQRFALRMVYSIELGFAPTGRVEG